MKLSKIILAILITIALLVVARRASQRQVPVVVETTTYSELTLSHTCNHIFKGDNTTADLDVIVSGGLVPEDAVIALYYEPRSTEGGTTGAIETGTRPARIEAITIPGQALVYRVVVPNQGRGSEFSYRFQLEDAAGRVLARIPVEESKDKPKQLWFRFEGPRSTILLIAHIACMFVSFLLMVFVLLTAFEDVKNKAVRIRLGKQTLWATIILFLGTFPIGIWLEYQVYATYWTGIPFGHDITDSKALIIFIYWFVMLYLLKGSALSGDPRKDVIGATATRWVAVVGVVLSLALYLVPHSSGSF
jgi:hypothetical protein